MAHHQGVTMRKLVLLSALLASGAAHADFIPRVIHGYNVVTVSVNGGSLSYSENQSTGGPLGAMVIDAQYTPFLLTSELNQFMARNVNRDGVQFLNGKLTGLPEVTLRPSGNGTALVSLGGISYQARSQYKGSRLGFITFECVNTLGVNNINVTGQFGTADGAIPNSKVGMTANTTSSTDCDSNISWILPVIGNLLINKAEGTIDAALLDGLKNSISNMTDKLFFKRDANWLVGLNRLVPADKVVATPGGGSFPIGQYIQNNLAYLLSNSQISIKLGKGANLSPIIGQNEPSSNVLQGDAITITVDSPGVNFSVVLSEEVVVNWHFQCSIAKPSKKCNDPR